MFAKILCELAGNLWTGNPSRQPLLSAQAHRAVAFGGPITTARGQHAQPLR